jgi:hypothetical protein
MHYPSHAPYLIILITFVKWTFYHGLKDTEYCVNGKSLRRGTEAYEYLLHVHIITWSKDWTRTGVDVTTVTGVEMRFFKDA